jgi:hypothetical protein
MPEEETGRTYSEREKKIHHARMPCMAVFSALTDV